MDLNIIIFDFKFFELVLFHTQIDLSIQYIQGILLSIQNGD